MGSWGLFVGVFVVSSSAFCVFIKGVLIQLHASIVIPARIRNSEWLHRAVCAVQKLPEAFMRVGKGKKLDCRPSFEMSKIF